MSLPTNIKQVQIKSFKQEISEPLTYGDVIYFQGMGEVTTIQGEANQDETQNVTYKVGVKLSDVKKAKDEVTEPKSIVTDKKLREKSESQALRQLAYRVGQETGESEEGLYREAISRGREYLEDKLDRIQDERKL